MGKKHRKKKKRSQLNTFVAAANTEISEVNRPELQEHRGVGIDLVHDEPIIADTKGVNHEIRNIIILMLCLASVIVIVAIINIQTSYVNNFGSTLMRTLHIWGA